MSGQDQIAAGDQAQAQPSGMKKAVPVEPLYGTGRVDGRDPAAPAGWPESISSADAAGAGNVLHVQMEDLTYQVTVAGSGPPLLLLHGFTGSTASWERQFAVFSAGYRVLGVDLIGHGGTDAPADPTRYTMDRVVQDVLTLLGRLAPRTPVRVLGYSMGGRTALALAAAAPERVAALILESASAGIAGAEKRAARVAADTALAARIEAEGVSAFVDYWAQLPLFATQRGLPREVLATQRAQRLANRAVGLANSLRGMGAGAQAPLHDRLPLLPMPVLLIAGALDGKYRVLAEEMAGRIPRSMVDIVEHAGHTVHLEAPARFNAAVLAFLAAVDRGHAGATPCPTSLLKRAAPAAVGSDIVEG
jgi:2-succinyl-6-hydroxy-2,4-cyclohexadiene-1-carboxylate synthase